MNIYHKLLLILLVCLSSACKQQRNVLTPDELAFLKESQPTVLTGYNAPPDAFRNNKGENVGIMVDLRHELEKIIGLRFRTKNFDTWEEVLNYAKNNRNYLIVGAAVTRKRLEYLDFTNSLMDIPYVLVTQRDGPNLQTILNDPQSFKICSVKGYAVNTFIDDTYPELNRNTVDDDLTGLKKVSSGIFDGMIVKLNTASYLIQKQGITNLNIADNIGYTNALCVAVAKEDQYLKSILQKVVIQVEEETKKQIAEKWLSLGAHIVNPRTIKIIWTTFAVFIVITLCLWLWARSLESQVRKRTAMLKKMQQQSADILAGINGGTWDWDLISGTQTVNPRWAEILGFQQTDVETVYSANVMERVHPDDLARVQAALDALLDGQTSFLNIDLRLQTKSDTWVWVNTRGKISDYNKQQKPIRMSGVLIDITPQKKNEAMKLTHLKIVDYGVTHSEPEIIQLFMHEMQRLTASSFSFFHIFQPESPTLFWTQELIQELLPTNYRTPSIIQQLTEQWNLCLKNRSSVLSNKLCITRTASHSLENLILVPTLRGEKVLAIWGIANKPSDYDSMDLDTLIESSDLLWEVIERKRAEFDKIKEQRANRAKSIFLANMSHEIRTPMNAILGFTTLLKQNEIEPKKLKYIQTIENSGKSLLNLINDILDLSKVEAGKLQFNPTTQSLIATIDDLLCALAIKSEEKGIYLQKQVQAGFPPFVILDHHRLRQVLVNLVNNAIKFTETGGVTIQASFTPQTNQDHIIDLQLKVIDTGKGVPAEQIPLIFKPFTQVEGQKVEEYGGTGLGLAITQSIIHAMNGTIKLESDLGQGTQITIDLPNIHTVDASDATLQIPASNKPIAFKGQTILIADDKSVNRWLIKEFLAEYQLRFIEAADGEEAIMRIQTDKPDLVLLDIRMPKMNGYEVAQLAQNDPETAKIPLIGVTASVMAEDQSTMTTHLCSFLPKPLTPEALVNKLKEYLNYEEVD